MYTHLVLHIGFLSSNQEGKVQTLHQFAGIVVNCSTMNTLKNMFADVNLNWFEWKLAFILQYQHNCVSF